MGRRGNVAWKVWLVAFVACFVVSTVFPFVENPFIRFELVETVEVDVRVISSRPLVITVHGSLRMTTRATHRIGVEVTNSEGVLVGSSELVFETSSSLIKTVYSSCEFSVPEPGIYSVTLYGGSGEITIAQAQTVLQGVLGAGTALLIFVGIIGFCLSLRDTGESETD